MTRLIPAVEFTSDENLPSIGRPHGKVSPVDSSHIHGVGSQYLIEPVMRTLVKQVQVIIGKQAHIMAHRWDIFCPFASLPCLFTFTLCHARDTLHQTLFTLQDTTLFSA